MKMRTDFVTNSSSSSFILARKSGFTDKQKEEGLLEYYTETQEEVRNALKMGKTVYNGYISFEESDYNYANIFENIWEIMKAYGDGNFDEIAYD